MKTNSIVRRMLIIDNFELKESVIICRQIIKTSKKHSNFVIGLVIVGISTMVFSTILLLNITL